MAAKPEAPEDIMQKLPQVDVLQEQGNLVS
jgi:hypothetical protein